MNKFLAVLFMLALLTACVSNKSRKPEHYFVTHIAEDGSKLFSFTMNLNKGSRMKKRERRDGSERSKGQQKRQNGGQSKEGAAQQGKGNITALLDRIYG